MEFVEGLGVESDDLSDWTELHRAALVGDHDAIRRLVAAGHDIDETMWARVATIPDSPFDMTALMVAAASGEGATAETLKVLVDLGADVDPARSRHVVPRSVLACAAASGDPARVAALIDSGAPLAPTLPIGEDDLPLYRVARSGSAPCVRLLLEAGVPLLISIDDERLSVLGLSGSVEVIDALLEAGADPNESGDGWYPTAVGMIAEGPAPRSERAAMIDRLIVAGVDLNDPEAEILSRAIFGALASDPEPGAADAVDVLLAAGADPTVGRPIESVCCHGGLLPHPKYEHLIDLLLDAGANPNEPGERGHHPLHTALGPWRAPEGFPGSDGGNTSAALALIRRGSAIDVEMPVNGWQPLHFAAAAAADLVVEALLAKGADPAHRARVSGETPLDLARAAAEGTAEWPPRTARWAVESAKRCVALLEAAPHR